MHLRWSQVFTFKLVCLLRDHSQTYEKNEDQTGEADKPDEVVTALRQSRALVGHPRISDQYIFNATEGAFPLRSHR